MPAKTAIEGFAWTVARRCRSIVQTCLREEEWIDADEEFAAAIGNEISLWLKLKDTMPLPIEGSIGT